MVDDWMHVWSNIYAFICAIYNLQRRGSVLRSGMRDLFLISKTLSSLNADDNNARWEILRDWSTTVPYRSGRRMIRDHTHSTRDA